MVPSSVSALSPTIIYPDSDGQPLADNTQQAEWIVLLFSNIQALFGSVLDIFVAMDNLWYPVLGSPEIRVAPDVYIVFGRPKGHRGSYKQWEEQGVPLTVVFEMLSPRNSVDEMIDKHAFYEEYGVEEYYIYNPDTNRLIVYLRQGELLIRRRFAKEFISPRLGIRFDCSGPEMTVHHPDGERFLTVDELRSSRAEARQEAEQLQHRLDRMGYLSRAARLQEASPEELAELERLETDISSASS